MPSISNTCNDCFYECNLNTDCIFYSWLNSDLIDWGNDTYCNINISPPPPVTTTAFLSVKVLKNNANKEYILNYLCPILTNSIPYTPLTICKDVFYSSIAIYYGMLYKPNEIYMIRDYIQKNLTKLTSDAHFFCSNTIAIGTKTDGTNEHIIYRCIPSKISCI